MFEAFRQDFRHAMHDLRRSRTFTFGATLTIALGIGVSAAAVLSPARRAARLDPVAALRAE